MITKKLQSIALAALFLDKEERNRDTVLKTRKRLCWVRSWLQLREEKAVTTSLFKERLVEDTEFFREFARMGKNHFQFLVNPFSGNPAKWSNALKQFVGKLLTNCLSVFDHFVGLALKGLKNYGTIYGRKTTERVKV